MAIITVDGTIMGGRRLRQEADRCRPPRRARQSRGAAGRLARRHRHRQRLYLSSPEKLLADRKIPHGRQHGQHGSQRRLLRRAWRPVRKRKTIYAEPTCWTGSIGVIIPHYDLAGLLAKFDVQDDSIASHPLKQMGSPTARLPEKYREEEKQILQQLVDVTFERFKEIVLASRPALKADDASAGGRVHRANLHCRRSPAEPPGRRTGIHRRRHRPRARTGCAAAERGSGGEVSKADQLFRSGAIRPGEPAARVDLASLVDLAAPRAFYLCTLLPAVLRAE